MKKFCCIVSIIVLTIASYSFAQDIAVLYDTAMENGAGLSIPGGVAGASGLADQIVSKLQDENLTAEIVDGEGVAAYMEANPKGIIVITQGNVPDTIFQNKGADDLIHSWLTDGGIAAMIGDWPFYYYWNYGTNSRVTIMGGGQQSVFGVTLTNSNTANASPTDLGKQYMPSIKQWTSNRPVGISVLEDNDFEFESYADDGSNADPIAYRTDDMDGWFINFHTSSGITIPPNDQIATELAELMVNRFATEAQSVDPTGKVSVVWGELKSLR